MVKKVTTPRSSNKGSNGPKIECRNKAPQDTYLPPDVEQSLYKPSCSTPPFTYPNIIIDSETEKHKNQAFWVSVRDNPDPDVKIKDRLTASELLGKSLAMFTENIDVKDDRAKLAAALINEKSKRENDQAR
jgi:hypothetical protein